MTVYDAYWVEEITIDGNSKETKLLKSRRTKKLIGQITNGGYTEVNLYWVDPDSDDDNPTKINDTSQVLGTSKKFDENMFSPWVLVEIKNTDDNAHDYSIALQAV